MLRATRTSVRCPARSQTGGASSWEKPSLSRLPTLQAGGVWLTLSCPLGERDLIGSPQMAAGMAICNRGALERSG